MSLVCIDEHGLLRDIERLLKKPIEKMVLPGFEPDPEHPRGADRERQARPGPVAAALGRQPPGERPEGCATPAGPVVARQRFARQRCPASLRFARPLTGPSSPRRRIQRPC
ncbi:MAG: hypothetical protein M5R42_15335 [Rhodocyclaceae bacterium]|nr:hypothetical protein [Rhodocyclaceae bacterium]